jgi:hypothetical protein
MSSFLHWQWVLFCTFRSFLSSQRAIIMLKFIPGRVTGLWKWSTYLLIMISKTCVKWQESILSGRYQIRYCTRRCTWNFNQSTLTLGLSHWILPTVKLKKQGCFFLQFVGNHIPKLFDNYDCPTKISNTTT